MKLFGRKHRDREPEFAFDPNTMEAVIRSSICTGEKTFGFRVKATGEFHDLGIVRTEEDLLKFKKQYGVTTVKTIY